jgi:4-amino-4-deoxy-L-arabinose transferase-like glycosyltransferase
LQSERRQVWALIALFLAVQSPFLPTAFRIDEPNILAIARQIERAPLDPYGFDINWNGTTEPAFGTLANPPLVPAWLALWAQAFGWSETSMHLAMMPFAAGALLAAASLARSLGLSPPLSAALMACSPAFFLGAQVVMPDLPMLAFVLGTLAGMGRFLTHGRFSDCLLAAVFAFAAPVAKYNAVVLIPVVLLTMVFARGRRTGLALVAGAPALSLALWGICSTMRYSEPHFLAIGRMQQAAALSPWTGVLCAMGLGVLPLAAFPALATHLKNRVFRFGAAALAVVLAVQAVLVLEYRPGPSILFGLSVTASILFIVVAIYRGAEAWRSRQPMLIALAALVATTLAMQQGLLFTSPRYLLPLLPAVLLLGASTRPVLLAANALFVVALGVGDALTAETYRDVIQSRAETIRVADNFYFAGHWGLQHYAEAAGGEAVDRNAPPKVGDDDLLIIARNAFPGVNARTIAPGVPGTTFDLGISWPLRTIDCSAAANFYGNAISGCEHFPVYLPFGWSTRPWERITVVGGTR